MIDKTIARETRSILLDKLLEDYELTKDDISQAVSLYYDAQKLRIIHQNKERSEGETPMRDWFDYWLSLGEKQLTHKLKRWVDGPDSPYEAKWAFSQVGIGPIIAAGLAANIDLERAKTVSSLWKFAGQAPGFDHRIKGVKLPYSAQLKTLCWKMGESFVKVSGKLDATYGRLYTKFKQEEVTRNEVGGNKARAAIELASKKFRNDTITRKKLESGMLSDAHLHSRAKRRTIKIFLQHYWLRGREAAGLPVTNPYIFDLGGHDISHMIR